MAEGRSISEMQQKIVDNNLVAAVAAGDAEKIDLCLKKGADINARWVGWHNRTPIMIAAGYARADLVEFVLTKNPDLFLRDVNGKSVFDITEEISDAATKKKINRLLLTALPDPVTAAPEHPAPQGAVQNDEIPVFKPIALDRHKKGGGSFQL